VILVVRKILTEILPKRWRTPPAIDFLVAPRLSSLARGRLLPVSPVCSSAGELVCGRPRLLLRKGLADLLLQELTQAFMDSRDGCAQRTLGYYRWAFAYLESQYVILPLDIAAVVELARNLPPCYRRGRLSISTKRSFYMALRILYAWIRANRVPDMVVLPYENFGRRRRGERRGRK